MKLSLNRSAELHYVLDVWRHGKKVRSLPKRRNLILDSGLDLVGTQAGFPCQADYGMLDDTVSPNPVRRDSGSITITQVGTAMVASGGFFQPADTGRLFKYNDGPGTEVYLTYVDATHATASASAAIGPINGTVWYVNQTALQHVAKTAYTFGSNPTDNGSTWVGGVQTNKRTLVWGAELGTVTYTAIGFNHDGTTTLFDRDVIPGGITLNAGDQARCVVEIIVTYSPVTPLAVGNVGTGCDSSGNSQIEAGGSLSFIQSSDGASFNSGIEPSNNAGGGFFVVNAGTFSMAGFDPALTSIANTPAGVSSPLICDTYTPGSFSRKARGAMNISTGNGNVYAVGIGPNFGLANRQFTLLLTTPFTKSSVQVLQPEFTLTWGRTLIN